MYKIIITRNNLYREMPLPIQEEPPYKIGTGLGCHLRLPKELFFSEFDFTVVRDKDTWRVLCEEELYYFTTVNHGKEYDMTLTHGIEVIFKHQDNTEILKLFFVIDFDNRSNKYDLMVELRGKERIEIGGGQQCDIYIQDSLLDSDSFYISKDKDGYNVTDNNSRYGVFINASKVGKSSSVRNMDFIFFAGYGFYLKGDALYTTRDEKIVIRGGLNLVEIKNQANHFQYPKFIRNTRIKYRIPNEKVEVLPPKSLSNPPKKNILLSLLPAVSMLVLTVVLRGIIGGGGSFVIYSTITMSVGIITSVLSYMTSKKEYKESVEDRAVKYQQYIDKREVVIKNLQEHELWIRRRLFKSLDENIQNIKDFSKDLFDRSIGDEDYLAVYVGTGTVEASCNIDYKSQGYVDTQDDLLELPEKLTEDYRFIQSVPITVQLLNDNGVGIIGSRDLSFEMLKNIALDLATRQFYREVKLFFIFNEHEKEKFEWLRWLTHVNNESLDTRNLMYDNESKNLTLEYLYKLLSERETVLAENNEEYVFPFQCVIFIYDSSDIYTHPVSNYFCEANRYGFHFVFFEEYEELLPKYCDEVIYLQNQSHEGLLVQSANGESTVRFKYKTISDVIAAELAVKLGPVFVEELSLESHLTKSITLFELLKICFVEDLDLETRWASAEVFESMAAPLGVKTKNATVYLDINEKHHGPHGLVAGTTGSGKSEILQSYILSMCTLFSPYEVGFVIIDFKGGGMSDQFRNLPHLRGTIVNVDGNQVSRSLKSIKAEIKRRQVIFSEYQINHIDMYIQLFRSGTAKRPLPHLIIIVDEFAELKHDYPDFMKELISAARIGRSLGVHLILATQKPTGVVDPQIWSNSTFKLCLKVQTKEDSNEVLKTPLAAEIREPGRAYLQVGNNEIFELFQSAYSGAPIPSAIDMEKSFSLYELELWGKKNEVYTNKKSVEKEKKEKADNQLQAIVTHIAEYCKEKIKLPLANICMPPLKDVIYYDELALDKPERTEEGVFAAIGVFDDPDNQIQQPLVIDIADGNGYIVGSSLSGKTTLLQTMIYSLLDNYSSDEVNIYILDFGNLALKIFEDAKHVGGVAVREDDELVGNLFKMLNQETESRKAVFSRQSVSTHKAYRQAGFMGLPNIFLVIDNIVSFKEYFPEHESDLLFLSREGQSAGINIIATSTATTSIGYKTLGNFGTRIALNCNDKGEYSNLFDRCRVEPKDTEGRGLFVIEKRIVEFQTALCVDGDTEKLRSEKIKAYIESVNSKKGARAKPIPQVPEVIEFTKLFNENRGLYSTPYKIPFGIDFKTVDYRYLELQRQGTLSVFGREKGGKSNFILSLLQAVGKTIFVNMTEAYIIDDSRQKLKMAKDFGFVKKYTLDHTEADVIIPEVAEILAVRSQKAKEIEGYTPDKETLQLLIINNREFYELCARDKELYGILMQICRNHVNLKVMVVFAGLDNTAVAYNAPDILKYIKDTKKAIIFDDYQNIKFFDTNMKYNKEFSKPITPGEAYLYMGDYNKVKTIKNL